MPFHLLSPQKIQHHTGYMVQGGDRFHLEYLVEGKKLVIPVEDRAEANYDIFWDKISGWEPPHEKVKISREELKTIMDNVSSALEFQKL